MKKRCVVGGALIIFFFSFFVSNVFAEVNVTVHVESATSTLFKGDIIVQSCAPHASSTLEVSAYCALNQTGLSSIWSSFGDDEFLDSIYGISNDYGNNTYWSWFSNMEYGQTALNKHILTSGEKLLITYGKFPLKIEVSSTSPSLFSTTTIQVTEFGFDSSWNGIWLHSASSTLTKDSDTQNIQQNGMYELYISTTTPFTLIASKNGFLASEEMIISPTVVSDPATTTLPVVPPPHNGGNSQSQEFDVDAALQFLESHQQSDGSFGSSLQTDWAAIAFAAADSNAQLKSKAYLMSSTPPLSSVTDYERHAMALMALGINPYSGTSINYIQKILEQFDGKQVGDKSLINDDVFALFPLMRAGYTVHDVEIENIVQHILSKQDTNGSWNNSVDLTSAAIQALTLAQSLNGVEHSLDTAYEYIISQRQSDGDFNSSFATSWALQAFEALDESISSDVLSHFQEADGGLEPLSASEGTRVWATAYAIPAGLNKTWADILSSFKKPVVNEDKEGEIEQPLRKIPQVSTTTLPTLIPVLPTVSSLLTSFSPITHVPVSIITEEEKITTAENTGEEKINKNQFHNEIAVASVSNSMNKNSLIYSIVGIVIVCSICGGVYLRKRLYKV